MQVILCVRPHAAASMARRQINLASLLFFSAASAVAQTPHLAAPVLTLDMPYGGCRLTITSDGGATLANGALPAWIEVSPGAFEPNRLLALFRSLVKPESSRNELKPPVGALTLHPSEELQWFSAAAQAHAPALFLHALKNRSPKQLSNHYPAAEAIIVNACSAAKAQ